MAKAVWSNQQVANNLLREGLKLTGSTVTFGFPAIAPSWSMGNEGNGFSVANVNQQTAAMLAIGLWNDLVAMDFVQAASNPKITFQNTTTSIGFAHAYFPSSYAAGSSVWLNPQYTGDNNLANPTVGKWNFMTYLHELGHALGLDHPGDYPNNANYANNALYMQDSLQYTVMSYFYEDNTGADWIASDGKWYVPQTPMIHDILAIQQLYGAETTTRTGNTVYGFNSNADRSVFDFTQNKHPIIAIWDSAGNDTLDLSGFTTPSRINLAPGSYSDADGMTKNISIANGAWIENAAGGSGNDIITGNSDSNTLCGNGGNDTLDGGVGADTMVGGADSDTYYVENAADKVIEAAGGGTADKVLASVNYTLAAGQQVEFLQTNASTGTTTIILTGNELGQTITGNNGKNSLYGGGGIDTLMGLNGGDALDGQAGHDTLTGGAGADQFVFRQSGLTAVNSDVITDFAADDFISFDTSVAGALDPTKFVNGTAAAGPEDRFIYDSATGNLFFDVDGTGATGQILLATLSTTTHFALAAADIILF